MRVSASSYLQVSLFLEGEFVGTELFQQSSIVIGSGPKADLRLLDRDIHPKHAMITCGNGRVVVHNLSRTHQTFVEGRSIDSSQVSPRDAIVIGSHELRVTVVSPRPLPIALDLDDEPETVVVQSEPQRPAPQRQERLPPPPPPPEPEIEPAPPQVHYEDDEEEAEEKDERPGYSLVEKLLDLDGWEPAASGRTALEVIGWVDDQIRTTVLLHPGETHVLAATDPFGDRFQGLPLARFKGGHEAILEVPPELSVDILRRGTPHPGDDLENGQMIRRLGHMVRRIRLTSAAIILTQGNSGICLRFVSPPVIPQVEKKTTIEGPIRRAFGGAIVVHLMVGAAVGLASSSFHYEEKKEVWANIEQTDLRNVEIEVPVPEEQPAAEPEPVVENEPKEQAEPPPKRVKPRAKRSKAIAKTETVKTKGILGALGKMSIQAPGKKSLVVAASNLNAVQAPGGGGFRVGALIGKAPASDISVGGGGGGKLLTRGTASLIKDGSLIAGIAKSSGDVRARVARANRSLLKTQGSISREEVARVINDHLRDVQYCYEKSLITNPGLQGKLVIEWAIDPGGNVSRVRQKMSTLSSPAVFDCIGAGLRRWRFPKPQGGIVIVSYPFIFNSVGF